VAVKPPQRAITGDGIRFEYGAELTEDQAQMFLARAIRARKDVASFLRVPAPEIRVRMNYRISISFTKGTTVNLPVSRLPRLDPVWKTDPFTIHHEMTHVIAPASDSLWFLAEGIAVYVHTKLGPPAFPNQGEDVHRLLLKLEHERGSPIPLLESETYRNKAEHGPDRRLAYVQEGSFATWLIENQGVPKYLELMKGTDPRSVYGKSFEQLERGWRLMLATRK
jgi:hypothetical protein